MQPEIQNQDGGATPQETGASRRFEESFAVGPGRRVQRERKDRHARSERLLRAVEDGIWSWNTRTGAGEQTPRYAEQLGYLPGELAASPEEFKNLVHPDDLQRAAVALNACIGHGTRYRLELRLRTKSGDYRWFLCRGHAECGVGGQPLWICCSMADITERKLAEAEIHQNENRLKTLVDILQHPAHSLQQFLSFALEQALLLTGSHQGTIRRPLAYQADFVIEAYCGEGSTPDSGCWAEAAGKRRPIIETSPANGSGLRTRRMAIPVFQGGEVAGVLELSGKSSDYDDTDILQVSLLMDAVWSVFSRRQAEDERARAVQAAESANRAKSEFLANMSHEIRTPMNGVLGMTHILLESSLAPEQRTYADTIRASAEALMSLLNDVLDFSKIKMGNLSVSRVSFDLGAILQEIHAMMTPPARLARIRLSCRLDQDVPSRILGDPVRLRQVLLNLVGNAIKFTSEGEVSLHVKPADPAADAFLLFTVTDTGIGIPQDKVPLLFQKFTQVDTSMSRRFGGAGLGLAISKELVLLMGGEIGVESIPGKGSEFWFTLPI